jgi:hypothetical protein
MKSSKEDQIKALMAAVFLLGLVGLAFTGSIPGLGGLNFSPLIQDSQTVQLEDYYVNARNGEIISDTFGREFRGPSPSRRTI